MIGILYKPLCKLLIEQKHKLIQISLFAYKASLGCQYLILIHYTAIIFLLSNALLWGQLLLISEMIDEVIKEVKGILLG